MGAIRRGNSRFTSPGSSTLVTPMPIAAKVWPAKSAGPKWTPRSSMPRTWSTSTASSARSRPSQRAKPGARGPKSPKQSEGMVVSRLASAPERPSPAMASSSTGPRLVTAVRRLKAITIRLTASRRARRRESLGLLSACVCMGVTRTDFRVRQVHPSCTWPSSTDPRGNIMERTAMSKAPSPPPSFPRKRESRATSEATVLDSRIRGNDERRERELP